jgi:hypothetical protein
MRVDETAPSRDVAVGSRFLVRTVVIGLSLA